MKSYKTNFDNYDEFILEVIKNGAEICFGTSQAPVYLTVDDEFNFIITLEFNDESTVQIKGDETEDYLPNFFGYIYLKFHYNIENKYLWFEVNY